MASTRSSAGKLKSGFADFYQDTVDDIIKENRPYFFAEHLFQN